MKSANKKNIPYGRQSISNHDIAAVTDVLRSDFITQGPKIKEFEDALCRYTGAKYAVAVSSGTAALHIACLAAGIKKEDEVITSPITFVASANCILYCGGKPIFADIQKDMANIDPAEIEKMVTKKTRAIIPVHFAGHSCKMRAVRAIARKHGLVVIEDAAHALGAKYDDSAIGSCEYSDMTIFSFHPVKTITTGEGGAILTNSRELYRKLLLARNHGISKDYFIGRPDGDWYYEMQMLGFNYRMTDMQAALGTSQLKRADAFVSRRREIVDIYNKAFSDNGYFDISTEYDNAYSSCHLYQIRLHDRFKSKKKAIFSQLRSHKIGVQVHYIPVYWQPYYKKLGYERGLCPLAEDFYERVISIPIYPAMTRNDVACVIKTIYRVFERF